MTAIGFGEVVAVSMRTRGDIPLEFTWRGCRYRVRSVERYHTETLRGLEHHTSYQIRTERGMRFRLLHDVGRSAWRMESVLTG